MDENDVVNPARIIRDFANRIYSKKESFTTIIYMHLAVGIKQLNLCKLTKYTDFNSVEWAVIDHPSFKLFTNKGHTYHCFFSKINGLTYRFGETVFSEEPKFCPLGPEILDLEISVNGCPKVGGHNCKFCYKNNSDKPPTNMSFETFVKLVSTFPKCLYSIAFGITGVQTNPDFPKMLQWCRENDIVPNYTLSGADLTDELLDITVKYCGACAVSCYEGNKQLCYDTIKRFHDKNPMFHTNMHIVLSEDEIQLKHVWDVLEDIKNGKVKGLNNIVFLRIKPVGRASKMNCQIHLETYKKIMTFCFENNIGFGFDSCSAKTAIKVLKNIGKVQYTQSCEPCESSKFSSYVAVDGKYWNCSFCERSDWFKPIDCLQYDDFQKVWNNPEVVRVRNIETEQSCPVYDLDSKE